MLVYLFQNSVKKKKKKRKEKKRKEKEKNAIVMSMLNLGQDRENDIFVNHQSIKI